MKKLTSLQIFISRSQKLKISSAFKEIDAKVGRKSIE